MAYTTINSVQELPHNAIIFKHSTTCGTSAKAKMALDELSKQHDIYLLVVQENRELCKEIEVKYGVRHESPQVLVLEKGRVAAVFNHWHIDGESIVKAFEARHSHWCNSYLVVTNHNLYKLFSLPFHCTTVLRHFKRKGFHVLS